MEKFLVNTGFSLSDMSYTLIEVVGGSHIIGPGTPDGSSTAVPFFGSELLGGSSSSLVVSFTASELLAVSYTTSLS